MICTCILTHSLIVTCSFAHSFTHSLTQSLTHLFTHQLLPPSLPPPPSQLSHTSQMLFRSGLRGLPWSPYQEMNSRQTYASLRYKIEQQWTQLSVYSGNRSDARIVKDVHFLVLALSLPLVPLVLPPLPLSPQLGGTIGDIEGMPFVEAFRQFQFRVGLKNFCNIHVSLVPQVHK